MSFRGRAGLPGVHAVSTGASPHEQRLLAAARAGDEGAFERLVEPHRVELRAHCYRMLGSLHDAEDALQDTLLRAWRGLAGFQGRSSLRNWLYRIATNACLNFRARQPKRVLPLDHVPAAELHAVPGRPLTESIWIEPLPDQDLREGFAGPEARYELRESVELAFVAALQHLSPQNRAVLILSEVLGFSAVEIAVALDTTTASVNSALQRARKAVASRVPAESQQSTLRSLGDGAVRELVDRYMDALDRADVDAVLALLVEDATWSMPPMSTWYQGREIVAAFLTEHALAVRWRHLVSHANGQIAVGCYAWDEERGAFVAMVLDVLTLRGPKIAAVTGFVDVRAVRCVGLPDTVSP
jgi:RNA polymerase sigma-70 factor (ECF subfamily)